MEKEKRTVNDHLCVTQDWLYNAAGAMKCVMHNCYRILDSDEKDPEVRNSCHKVVTALRFAMDDVNKVWFVLEGALLEKDIEFSDEEDSEQEAPVDE